MENKWLLITHVSELKVFFCHVTVSSGYNNI